MHRYKVFDTLQHHKTKLRDTVELGCGVRLASWSNSHDRVTMENTDHHTISLYVADGYESYHQTANGWRNGGGPDRFCLMPKDCISTWDIRGDLSFVHLYCDDGHFRRLAEQTWDRSPAVIRTEERIFGDDPQITTLYRQFLLNNSWADPANQLVLSSAATLLMLHILRQYTQLQWTLPEVRGGLAPAVQRRVKEMMENRLGEPLTLAELAAEAGLSEFHFARMFRQSEGMAPHQYILTRRLARAEEMLRRSALSITEIALLCGFSSASHLSHRFKSERGITPSALRRSLLR
ncbi:MULTISPECIES: AraC family transcriptional regulator [unclassified Brenneria]|uniref:AraC family transcriptional regulator n=1 Tax=unclassified Brenneria TaxID=2634434 RepID=UPI0029C26F9E|nr:MULTISPECIES: AraC family transcriptional regulator [unclassified Brenneria]MDX5627257.1 AraC family transcriptional regulator [Brenneria sp. L3-3Z]MDX5694587.1 AraC family transcriptional regulator [Brenneria sp. L4-2C]MEE3661805.1 AraC family transcriptional regulator [Brenneria sp. g21c3]